MAFRVQSPMSGLGFRGKVFKNVLATILVVVLGAAAFEAYVWYRTGGEEAEAQEVAPAYPMSRPWNYVVDKEERPAPPLPADAPAAPAAAPPAVQPRAQRGREQPQRSRGISWDLNQEGMQQAALFQDGRVANRWPGCSLKPGQYIEAVLLDRVDSEIAGSVNARVTAGVEDADGYRNQLVPEGSIVVGRYKTGGGMSLQRRRLDFTWDYISLPDGNMISLAEAEGADASGATGLGGTVTTNWGNIFMTTLVYAVLDAGQRSAISEDGGFAGDLQESTANSASRTGKAVVRELLSFEPRIVIPGSTVIRIKPRKIVRVC